jgi:hypothetical protein
MQASTLTVSCETPRAPSSDILGPGGTSGQLDAYNPGPELSINFQGVIAGTYFEPIAGNPFGGNYMVFIRSEDGTYITFATASCSALDATNDSVDSSHPRRSDEQSHCEQRRGGHRPSLSKHAYEATQGRLLTSLSDVVPRPRDDDEMAKIIPLRWSDSQHLQSCQR